MSTNPATFSHEIRPANLQASDRPTDAECFKAIDTWIREKEREWVVVARGCLEVQTRELWKYGDYHSWDDWLNKAAPRSARTIYWHINLVRGLESDFSDEELSTIAPEAAKVLRKVSKATRRDPDVRRAARGKRQALIAKVLETHPEELLETEVRKTFVFSASQWEKIQKALDCHKAMNNPSTPDEEIIEEWAAEYLGGQWEDSGYTVEQRSDQLRTMGATV